MAELENTMLSKISQTQKCKYFMLSLMDNLDCVYVIKARRGLFVGNR